MATRAKKVKTKSIMSQGQKRPQNSSDCSICNLDFKNVWARTPGPPFRCRFARQPLSSPQHLPPSSYIQGGRYTALCLFLIGTSVNVIPVLSVSTCHVGCQSYIVIWKRERERRLLNYDDQSCQADARVCKCSMDSYPETRPNPTRECSATSNKADTRATRQRL